MSEANSIPAACSADSGFRHSRTEIDDPTGHLEKALSELWAKKNRPEYSINYGNGLLQDLLIQTTGPFGQPWILSANVTHKVTDDERRVVATVVQWLGTNMGRLFLEEAFRNAGWRLRIEPPNAELSDRKETTNGR